MTRPLSFFAALLSVAVSTMATAARTQQPASTPDPWQQYVQLVRANTVQLFREQPFELHFDYQLYGLDGKPAGPGDVVETWGSGQTFQVHIHSATLDATEPSSSEQEIRTTTREHYLVLQALHSITMPLPVDVKQQDFAMFPNHQLVDGAQGDCFTLVQPPQQTRMSASFCPNSTHVITAMAGEGPFVLLRKNFRQYRGREVPMDIELSYNGKLALTAHVTELDSLQPPSDASTSAPGPGDSAERLPANIMAGFILKKKVPKYPGVAKAGHIQGAVLICAVIDEQGKIAALDVVSSPDPVLSKPAREAVQTWTYKPYLLNGKPAAVDTTITINFNLNR